jgi:hypothetical protein
MTKTKRRALGICFFVTLGANTSTFEFSSALEFYSDLMTNPSTRRQQHAMEAARQVPVREALNRPRHYASATPTPPGVRSS